MKKKWWTKKRIKYAALLIIIVIAFFPFLFSYIIKQPEDIKRWHYYEFDNEDLAIFFKINGKVPIKTGDTVNCKIGAIYRTSEDRTIMVNISGSHNTETEDDDFDFEYYSGKIYLEKSPEKTNDTARPERSWTHEGVEDIKFNYPGDISAQILIQGPNGEILKVFQFENLIYVDNSDTVLLQNLAVSTLLFTTGSLVYSIFIEKKDNNDNHSPK